MSTSSCWAAFVAVLLYLSHQAHSMSYRDLLVKTIWASDVFVGDLDLKGFRILHRQRDYLPISNVTSLAMHVNNNYLFVADSSGTIRRFNITFINSHNNNGKNKTILSSTTSTPLSHRTVMKFITLNQNQVNLSSVNQISVDWLNNMLYIVSGDGKIHRCDLDGYKFQTLIEGFDDKSLGPFNLQVDPINGYLFYSLKGDRKGGIYKIGLSEFPDLTIRSSHHTRGKKRNTIDTGSPKHFELYTRLIASTDITVFTLDYLDGKILYPRETSNTQYSTHSSTSTSIEMISLSIDGKHESIIRNEGHIQSSKFGNFKKLTYIEGLFQWMNGQQIFIEERRPRSMLTAITSSNYSLNLGHLKEYVHNSYSLPDTTGPVSSIVCFTEKLQPYPQPRLPVDDVTVVFAPNTAVVSWKQPKLLPEQDSSAWHGWLYELSIRRVNSTSEPEHIENNLKDTHTMIAQLSPDTEYIMKVRAYLGDNKSPWSKEFIGKTRASASILPSPHPGPPSQVKLKNIDSSKGLVEWFTPDVSGAESIYYQLLIADVNPYESSSHETWSIIYNGSSTQCLMKIAPNRSYKVKVKTITEYGQSISSESQPFTYLPIHTEPSSTLLPPKASQEYIIALTGFIALFLLASTAIFCAIFSHKRKETDSNDLDEHKKGLNELVSLPELPPHSHQTNVLYMPGFSVTDELAMIPHVRAEQIEKTKQLGEGAFGKVYEGYVHRLWGPHSGKTKVAIKTLPNIPAKQASMDFLKEAKLMSNFNHPHILRLMAVCVDGNSFINALILELMEGGDLKRYVASNRPTATCPSKLTMNDLLNICIDVAKGCKYLEDMHFIHRDIAARNCLVSSTDRTTRTVKIGDFGLARDVYKSDYYRKGTDALVPCRWMSPESLTHGKFTTQCDIWAFGVLMWEVMTLGEQPYSSLGNTAVLNYVRCGGILGKPEACPQDLYTLMKLCWSFDPLKRPTFAMLLQRLEEFASRTDFDSAAHITMTSVHNHSYRTNYLLSPQNTTSTRMTLVDITDNSTDIGTEPRGTNDSHYVNEITDGGQQITRVPSVVSSGIDTLREEPRQCASQGAVIGINAYINSSVIASDLLKKNITATSAPFNRSLTLLSKVNETFPRNSLTQHKVIIHNLNNTGRQEDWSSFESEGDSTCTSSSSGTSSQMVDSSHESIVIHEYQLPRSSACTIFKSASRLPRMPVVTSASISHCNYNNNNNNNYSSIDRKEDDTRSSIVMKDAQLIFTGSVSSTHRVKE